MYQGADQDGDEMVGGTRSQMMKEALCQARPFVFCLIVNNFEESLTWSNLFQSKTLDDKVKDRLERGETSTCVCVWGGERNQQWQKQRETAKGDHQSWHIRGHLVGLYQGGVICNR